MMFKDTLWEPGTFSRKRPPNQPLTLSTASSASLEEIRAGIWSALVELTVFFHPSYVVIAFHEDPSPTSNRGNFQSFLVFAHAFSSPGLALFQQPNYR
jgi:hypothetical protein